MNSRWHIAGEAAAAILLGATLWSYAMMTPALDWNAARLFPAMLMAAGRSPYFPAMSGPATGWIYGPIMPMLHLPASLAPTITSAMVVSACINAAAFVLPILAVADYAAWRCGFRRERLAIAVTCLGLLLAQPGLNNYLLWIQSDQVAIGLALLSCVFLARENLVGAAALAVLAVWTKQIAIAVPLAHAVYLIALRREPTDALRYIAWFAVIGIAVSAVMVRLFGLEPLVYNLWIVPSGNHLKDWQTVWIANTLELLKEGSPSLIVAAACWRVAGDFHRWPNLNSIVKVLLTLAVCQLPFGLLAAAKIGGGNNSFHLVGTLYTVAIVCAVGAAATRRETLRRRHFTWTSVAAALLVCF